VRRALLCSLSAVVLVTVHAQAPRPLPASVPERLGRAILGFERAQADPSVAGMMDVALARWGFAVQWWLAAAHGDPGARLASGVLLECVAHRAGTGLISQNMLPEAARGRCMSFSPSDCHRQARRVYARVIAEKKERAATPEIALRVARLESLDDPRRGQETLRELAGSSGDARMKYLATLFLGASAEARREIDAARSAYREAMRIDPRWSSARFAAATLSVRAGDIPRDALVQPSVDEGPPDPYYGYPCTILTASVATELESRQQRLFER
jgi:hypothetical protein